MKRMKEVKYRMCGEADDGRTQIDARAEVQKNRFTLTTFGDCPIILISVTLLAHFLFRLM